jgi:hypothetical protein
MAALSRMTIMSLGMLPVYFILLFLVAIACLLVRVWASDRDGSWRPAADFKMRRMSRDGFWQYREMSRDEEEEFIDEYNERQY